MDANLKAQYDRLWHQSMRQFTMGQFEFDPLIDSKNDTRFGMTLLARPSAQVRQNILQTLEKLKSAAPDQYYYPESDMHLTVLSIISCYPGFSINQVNEKDYIRIIKSVTDTISPFRIKFKGLTASSSCILVQGFPDSDQLNELRNELRTKFKQSGLQHSIDKRYQIQTAHMTVIRFKQPFTEEQKFIQILKELKEIDFGSCMIEEAELVENNWYQQKGKVSLLDRFQLSG